MNPSTLVAVLQIVGFALLLAEIFIPTGGILAIATTIAFAWSLWTAFDALGPAWGSLVLLLDLIAVPFAVRWGFNRIGSSSMGLPEQLKGNVQDEGVAKLLGAHGQTLTPLRPAGRVAIGDEQIDAISERGFIEAGTAVVVTRCDENRILVKPLPAQKS